MSEEEEEKIEEGVIEAHPDLVDIEVDGETVKVNSQVAALIERLKKAPPAAPTLSPPSSPPPAPPEIDDSKLEELWFSDPKKAAAIISERVQESIRREYIADVSKRDFWKTFKEKYPDLSDKGDLAEFILNKQADTLGHLSVDVGMKELARLVRNQLGVKEDVRLKRTSLTDSGGRREIVKASDQEEEFKPKSLSEIIREQRHARIKAGSNPPLRNRKE